MCFLHAETVVIGIGKQSVDYVPASKHATISKITATKRNVNATTIHAPPGYRVSVCDIYIHVYLHMCMYVYICKRVCLSLSV